MTKGYWGTKDGVSGFGLAGIKREGEKLHPIDYLNLNGHWPFPTFYTSKELADLKKEGIYYFETPNPTRCTI